MSDTIYGGTTTTPAPFAITDQTYNPESENAQSGKAVAQAIGNIEAVFDELHAYAQALISGGASE